MKNTFKSLIIAVLLLTGLSVHAGSSFWSGFGAGAFTGITGSAIAHNVSRPRHVVYERPVAVRTVHYTPVYSKPSRRQELDAAEREIDALEVKNSRLEAQLDQERALNRKEQRKQHRKINALQDTINDLELSIKKLEKRINKVT